MRENLLQRNWNIFGLNLEECYTLETPDVLPARAAYQLEQSSNVALQILYLLMQILLVLLQLTDTI